MIPWRSFIHLRSLAGSSRLASSFSKHGKCNLHTSEAAASVEQVQGDFIQRDDNDEYAVVDWDRLGFNLITTDYMYMAKCSKDGNFEDGFVRRYKNIELSPAAGVLNYGQGLFEGTKAYRKENGGLLLFRPAENAIRMKTGSERMCMPSPSVDQFVDAVKQTVLANKRWVPPPGKGSLYIRPLLMGSGAILGLTAAPEYSFLVYASPVQNYFKDCTAALNLYVEEEVARAYHGGTGAVKTVVNYGPVLQPMLRAKSRGYSDVLYLDAATRNNIEEASASNIFFVKGNLISTPAANGTILEGVTRKSIMDIARDHGYEVVERAISVDELKDFDEVFCTGTAVGVASVGSITYKNIRTEYRAGRGSVSEQLQTTLVGIQTGHVEDDRGWVVEI